MKRRHPRERSVILWEETCSSATNTSPRPSYSIRSRPPSIRFRSTALRHPPPQCATINSRHFKRPATHIRSLLPSLAHARPITSPSYLPPLSRRPLEASAPPPWRRSRSRRRTCSSCRPPTRPILTMISITPVSKCPHRSIMSSTCRPIRDKCPIHRSCLRI